MSQANELLETIAEDGVSTYTADMTVEPHIIIGEDRVIRVPDELKRIAVQFDHNIETVIFDCPRYWDGYDMSKMDIRINYMRPDGLKGCCKAKNITTGDEYGRPEDNLDSSIMHFEWTILRELTYIKGPITFNVCIILKNEYGEEVNHWNSELNKEMYISEGMECDCSGEESEDSDDIFDVETVDFYDYDGTLVYSYTLREVQTLTELPQPPEHMGLISQGWNFDLETIKNNDRELIVGAMYITDDGKTRLYITIDDDDLTTVPLYFSQDTENSVIIDWGDGSETESIDGVGYVSTSHTYNIKGNYVITMNVMDGSVVTLSGGTYQGLLGSISDKVSAYSLLLRKVEIGNNINDISSWAFYNCRYMETITMPEGITIIDNYSFRDCVSLKTVIIPKTTTVIGDYAFDNAINMDTVSVPNDITNVGPYAFIRCRSLNNIVPPGAFLHSSYIFDSCSGLQKMSLIDQNDIPTYTFLNAYGLKTLCIAEGCTNIGNNAFQNCYTLQSVVLPDTIKTIGTSAFSRCYNLSIDNLPASLMLINKEAFAYCERLRAVRITNDNVNIGQSAFTDCKNLSVVELKGENITIGSSAFMRCSAIEEIVFSEKLASLGMSAFYNCTGLRRVVFGVDTVTTIASGVFSGCTNVKYYDFTSYTTVPTLANVNAFNNIPSDCEIRVPAALYSDWIAAANWSSLVNNIVAKSTDVGEW